VAQRGEPIGFISHQLNGLFEQPLSGIEAAQTC